MKILQLIMSRLCILKSLFNEIEICLKPGEELILGRSPTTNITDLSCARQQVSVRFLPDKEELIVKRLGVNPSSINGFCIQKDKEYTAKNSDTLELISNNFIYQIKMDFSKEKESSVADYEVPQYETWESIDNGQLLIFTSKGVVPTKKIAGFDIDGTIIKTKSGRVFAKTPDDWQLAFPQVVKKLKSAHEDGFKIVFFTNQRGIELKQVTTKEIKQKIESIIKEIDLPIQVFVATSGGYYRKPQIGMWTTLEKEKNNNLLIDYGASFYVGDAAGRMENKHLKRKKDHSHADRYMALNLGIKFLTPEEYFQNAPTEKWDNLDYDPVRYVRTSKKSSFSLPTDKQEVILMVGLPGSGKSSFCRNNLPGYTRINQDTLKSWQRCVETLEKTLREKKSAVIDNTNVDEASRSRYINVAKSFKVPIRCFFMTTTERHCLHNLAFRESKDPSYPKIPRMVYNSLKKSWLPPSEKEGFEEIVPLFFNAEFKNNSDKLLYEQYLLEK